jgi:quercetin dioxygenase-like cupin family protein
MKGTTIGRSSALAIVAASLAAAGVLWAQPDRSMHMGGTPDHIMIVPDELSWSPAPNSLPPGAQIAILEGDPTRAGPLTFRVKVPAGYEIPAHHHPQIEHVTVISGKFFMGTGDKLDRQRATALPPGGFAVMAIGTRHFAFADEETVVQIHGIGPWGITYVDPAMDPRNKDDR